MILKRNVLTLLLLGSASYSVYAQEATTIQTAPVLQADSIRVLSPQEQQSLDNLDAQLKAKNYATAKKVIINENIPPISASERIKVFAEAGSTPAMWLLAEQYRLANRMQDSANWTYTAFLGTRIDSSLCINQQAPALEKNIISSFNLTVQEARKDPSTMRDAIVFALEKQQDVKDNDRDPEWICLLLDYPKGTNGVVSKSQWSSIIQHQIKRFDEGTRRREQ